MSFINRVSTLALHQRTLSDVGRLQTNLANLQIQISSGHKTENFQGINGEVEQFTALEAEITKMKNFQTNLAEATSRFQTQDKSLDEMISIAEQMRSLLTARRNGATGETISYGVQMDGMVSSLARELNTTFGGRFIFGGTRTNVQPVVTEPDIPSPVTSGVPDDGYYQGSKENIITRPREDLDIEYEVRADNEAFQKILAAASLSMEGDSENSDAKLQGAFGMLSEGMEALISVRSGVAAKIIDLQNINVRHDSMVKYFQGVTESIINTDMVAASTQVAVDQTILQASFQSFARINTLRLVDFLQ